MAETDLTRPFSRSMGIGLRVPGAPLAGDPATRMGLESLRPTAADTAVSGAFVPPPQERVLAGLSGSNLARAQAMLAAPPIVAPPALADANRAPATAYFNLSTNEMFAGNRVFKLDDVSTALEAAQSPANTTRPEGQGWTAMPEGEFNNYLASLSQRRGFGEKLFRGTKNVAYGFAALPGTAASLLGFEETGAAMRAPAEYIFGESEDEQIRSALIAENSTLWEKIWDASVESIPFLLTSFAGGIGGASLAGRGVGLTDAAVKAAKVKGAIRGATYINFPTHLASMYDSAVRNGQDLSGLDTKALIVGGALANTIVERFGIESRLFSPAVRDAVTQTAFRTVRNRLLAGGAVGLQEAGTEVFQTAMETLLFDPEVRDKLTPQDWKTILPYALETYGESYLVAAGAGALLGGGIGTILPQGAAAPRTKAPVDTKKPLDLNQTATEQATEKEEPPMGPMQGPRLEDYMQGPAPLGPMQGPMPLGEMQGPRLEDYMQGPAPLGPMQGPAPLGPMQGPMPLGPMQGPMPLGPMQGPMPLGPMQGPMPLGPMQGPMPLGEMQGPPAPITLLRANERQAEVARRNAELDAAQTMDVARGAMARSLLRGRRQSEVERQGAAADAVLEGDIAQAAADRALQRAARGEEFASRSQEADAATAERVAAGATFADRLYYSNLMAAEARVEAADRALIQARATGDKIQQQRAGAEAIAAARELAGLRSRLEDVSAGVTPDTRLPPAPLGPMQGPMPLGEMQGPMPLGEMQGPPAPAAPKSDVVSETVVGPEGLTLVHGGKPGLTLGSIQIVRGAGQMRQGKKGRVYGGFYATSEAEAEQATGYAGEGGAVYDVRVAPGTRVAQRGGDITRLSKQTIDQYVADGYGVVYGTDPRGRTEFVVVDKAAIESVAPRTAPEPTPPTKPAGPGKGTKSATVRKGAKAEPKGTKAAAVRRGAAAQPKPRAEAPPAPTPAPKIQTPEQKPTLAERVEALTDEQALALQDLLPGDLDAMIERRPDMVEAALDRLERKGSRKAPPARTPEQIAADSAKELAALSGARQETIALGRMISDFNQSPGRVTEGWKKEFARLAAAVRASNPDAPLGLTRMLDYANPDNTPNIVSTPAGRQTIAPLTGRTVLADWNTVDGATDLNGKPVLPLPAGRVDLLVKNYLRKLKRPPTVTVARDQADLKAKNPELYRKAKAASGRSDFDTVNALGYSFGDGQVIVFSGRIGSESQLNFVLAHEALGHYGLRAIMPADKFDATMEQVYKSNPAVAAVVNNAVQARGLSRSEAVEEYLADYAAVLDMSVLRRVAVAMKNALNSIGFKFSDDMVRHLLRTSRRYVRNGKRDNLFTTSDLFRDVQAIESGVDALKTGRFKEGFKTDNLMTDRLTYDVHGGLPRSIEDFMAVLKPKAEGAANSADSFVRKYFSLTAFNALDNAGLTRLVRVLFDGGNKSTEVRNRADETMRPAFNSEVRILGIKVKGGITETEQLAASRLAYQQQNDVRGKADKKADDLVRALRDKGISPRMFSIVDDRVVESGKGKAIEAYRAAGRLSLPEAKAILAKDDRFKDIASKLDKDHPTWKAYESIRDAHDDVQVEFVRVQYENLLANRRNGVDAMEDLLRPDADGKPQPLTDEDKKFLQQAMDKYYALYSGGAVTIEDNLIAAEGSAKKAAEFARLLNEAVIAKGFDTTKEDALRKFFADKPADDFVAQVVAFRKRVMRTPDNEFLLQKKIQEIGAAELSYNSAELSVRKMLVQGYTPIFRQESPFQMRLVAVDPETGDFVQMSEEFRGLAAYRVFDTAEEATKLAEQSNKIFSDMTAPTSPDVEIITLKDGSKKRVYTVDGRTTGDADFKSRKVELRFEVSAAASGVYTPLQLNLHEFLRGIRQYGLNVQPKQLEEIVVNMTAQDARARKRLEQTGNPGYEVQGGVTALQAIARFIDTRASVIAKIQMQPEVDRLMNVKLSESRKLWFGDKERLAKLKKAYDDAVSSGAPEDVVFLAKRDYDDYATKMQNTIKKVNGVDVNMGNKYLSEAHSLMAFINGNRDVNETDWGAGPVASSVRRWAGAAQLGGSLAQPIMNNIGPFTNFIPWLGSYNQKTGFGGGAGFTTAYAQYMRALSDVGGMGGMSFTKRALEMNTAAYWDKVATGLETHDGVQTHEAEFIAKETLRGILTPAQANSLLGNARNFTTNPAIRQALDKWMYFYVSSEQATRRSAALAAFRVEWDRQLSRLGKPVDKLSRKEYEAIHAKATEFATNGVQLTLGEYGALNRPAAWRSGLQSFLYMYKVWPTTSIQTLKRMDWRGRAAMLGPLVLLSGLSAVPFLEDGEDLLDTILQQLGMTVGSVRLEFARLIDEVMPGMSPFILKGVVSQLLGVDVASRFDLSDFIPGTAAFIPGQDLSQTFREVGGPAWGFLEGLVVGGAIGVAAPFSETATAVDALRYGPVVLGRVLGDVAAFTSSGAVIDKRGYVIEPEMNTSTLIARVLGFTPASVAAQYEVVRLAKRETNYQKQVVAKFRTQLLKAEMAGDRKAAASIRRLVKEWNAETKGTLLEIKNFEKNYQRFAKQGLMSAKKRFLQSAGKANEELIELIGELVSYD